MPEEATNHATLEMSGDRSRKPTWSSRLHRRLAVVSLILVVCSIAGEFGEVHWFPDLFSHFQFQYLWIAGFALSICIFSKRWKLTLVTGCIFAWFAVQVSPLWLDKSRHSTNTANLRVLSINIYAGNTEFEKILRLIGRSEADVVVLQEVTDAAVETLLQLTDDWPHHEIIPRPDAFGIAILSRHKFESVRTKLVGEVPWIEAQLLVEGRPIRVLAAHTLPPMGTKYATTRNQQLGEITKAAQRARDAGEDLIVAGDLNCTRWSPWMRKTLGDSEIASARSGFGFAGTWPTNRAPLIIPIDHVLVSPKIRVKDFRVGEKMGSDHLPVIADLVLRGREQ